MKQFTETRLELHRYFAKCLTGVSIEILKKASASNPHNCWTYFSLARLYQSLGKKTEAGTMWQAVLSLKNPDPFAVRIAKKEIKNMREKHDNNS